MKMFRFVFTVCLISGFLFLLNVVKADMGGGSPQSSEFTISTGDQKEEKLTFGGAPDAESSQTTCSMTPNGADGSIILEPPAVQPPRPEELRPYTPNLASVQPVAYRSTPYSDPGRRGRDYPPSISESDNNPSEENPNTPSPPPNPPSPPVLSPVTPEPATLLIFGAGIAGLWVSRRRMMK